MYLQNIPTRRLLSWLTRHEKTLAQKMDVIARHKAGTPYRTRAEREADVYRQYISVIMAELQRRGEMPPSSDKQP